MLLTKGLLCGSQDYLFQYRAGIEAVTPADVLAAARRLADLNSHHRHRHFSVSEFATFQPLGRCRLMFAVLAFTKAVA